MSIFIYQSVKHLFILLFIYLGIGIGIIGTGVPVYFLFIARTNKSNIEKKIIGKQIFIFIIIHFFILISFVPILFFIYVLLIILLTKNNIFVPSRKL